MAHPACLNTSVPIEIKLEILSEMSTIAHMRIQIFCSLALATVLALPVAAAPTGGKLKVLVVTGGHAFEKEPFFKVFKDNPNIEFTQATQVKSSEAYDREDLLSYDVVVLYDMVQKITDAQKTRFLSLFDKGIGLVVTHHAMGSYQDWPEYERIMGGKYLMKDEKEGEKTWPKSDYQHDVDLAVAIVAKDHPITAGFQDFTIHDEIYIGFRVRSDVTPLLATTHPRSGKTLAWCRTQGKSRVVYLELGHDHLAYENPNYQKVLANAISWAANKQ